MATLEKTFSAVQEQIVLLGRLAWSLLSSLFGAKNFFKLGYNLFIIQYFFSSKFGLLVLMFYAGAVCVGFLK